mmetsp:Transcript_39231/g.65141  ORF Transcript_39231/g.65141 Transcript_39231/m.65141 type:complete len:84 (+) Transcript_39231:114-365(+)
MPLEMMMATMNCVLVRLFVYSEGHGGHGYTSQIPATNVHAVRTQRIVCLKMMRLASPFLQHMTYRVQIVSRQVVGEFQTGSGG